MAYGYTGDVNNSISQASAYPSGRTMGLVPMGATRSRFRTNGQGELGAVNQGRNPRMGMGAGASTASASSAANAADVLPPPTSGVLGQPATWWIMWLVVFALFIWVARKFGGGGDGGARYGNLLPSVYNGIFLTLYVVLILNVLKVFATRFKIPGLSEMILAA